jgi:hypothetical protein
MTGYMAMVQESRFTLINDEGAGHMFLLGHSSLAEPSQLAELQRRQARVRVTYSTAPDLIALIARKVEVEN